jgi:hypothetical protein
MAFYLNQNGEQVGPYSEEQIISMVESGELSRDEFSWHEGLTEWQPIHSVVSLPAPVAPQPAPTPTQLPEVVERQPEQEKRRSGFGFDAAAIAAQGRAGDMYVVIQVVLTEKLLGTGSGTASLTNLQATINKQVAKGFRLHTISTTSSGSKGFLGGDKIQATMVFEKVL